MNELRDRLKELMQEQELKTQRDLAKFAGVSQGLVGQWFNGFTGLGKKPLLAFDRKTNFSTQWLADGTGKKYKNQNKQNENTVLTIKTIEETYREHLKNLIDQFGGQSKLAEKINKSSAQISQWVNGSPDSKTGKARSMKSDTAREIEKLLNLPYASLDQPASYNKAIQEPRGINRIDDKHDPILRGDDVEMPLYKEGFSDDTHSQFFEEGRHNCFKLKFSKSILARMGVCADHSVCVIADGNSMEPVFSDGAMLGVDLSQIRIKDGKIYLVNYQGLIRAKIIKQRPNNRILIQSFNNKDYPDEEINIDDVIIIGRVFWWAVLAQ